MRHAARLSILCGLLIFFLSVTLAPGQSLQYRIQPGDVLSITVHDQPDLTTKTRVSSDGSISFPLLGQVAAGDLTVQELERTIKDSLEKSYLVTAQVLVFIEQYHPRQVSVVGEVNKPGKYGMPEEKDLTILEAIALAGGFTKDAYTKQVKVMRQEDGVQKTLKVNVNDITVNDDTGTGFVLKADDVVIIPESFF